MKLDGSLVDLQNLVLYSWTKLNYSHSLINAALIKVEIITILKVTESHLPLEMMKSGNNRDDKHHPIC